jgi:hypothetical protein
MRKMMLLGARLYALAFTTGRLAAVALVLASVVPAAPAAAASAHTWVSTGGTDNGSCGSATSPCASFQGAYNNTASNGEITCLNSGSYGGVTISQPIAINCEGAVSTASSIYVGINGGDVVLRGLDFDGTGSNTANPCGIVNNSAASSAMVVFFGAGTLHLQKVKIDHLTGAGCGVQYIANSSALAPVNALDIADSDITGIGTSGTAAGVYVALASTFQSNLTIENSRINANYFGIIIDGTAGGSIRGVIKNSVVSDNVQNGITVSSNGATDVLLIDGTAVSSNNNHGLVAGGSGAGMLVRNTSVFNNGGGLYTVNGGTLYSYGNNSVNGNNGKDGTFTGTVSQQ